MHVNTDEADPRGTLMIIHGLFTDEYLYTGTTTDACREPVLQDRQHYQCSLRW